MNQDGIRAYIVENYYDNFISGITSIGTGTDVTGANVSLANPRNDEIDLDELLDRIMERTLDILKGGDNNDYVKFLRNKALENSTTLLKQTVADVIYVGQNDGTFPENPTSGGFLTGMGSNVSSTIVGPRLNSMTGGTMNNSNQGSGGPRGGGGRGGY